MSDEECEWPASLITALERLIEAIEATPSAFFDNIEVIDIDNIISGMTPATGATN